MEMPLARPAPTGADADAVPRPERRASGRSSSPATASTSRGVRGPRQLAERLGIPVATSSAGKGSIAETHDLALGTVGRYSRNYANAAVRDADVILAIGTQLGGLVTDSYRLINPEPELIHVTSIPRSIGLNFPTALGLVADARTFLEALLEACDRVERRHRGVGRHLDEAGARSGAPGVNDGRPGRAGRQ